MTNAPVFIEIDYTGTVEGHVFDTTRKEDAPEGSRGPFGAVIVKLGGGQLIPGLDAFLADKTSGTHSVTLDAEQAFGKKRADLLKLLPVTAFGKEQTRLEPGMPVTVGENQGYVKSISSGRVVVDFNHPLAGKAVSYNVTVHGIVTDPKKKVASVVSAVFGMPLPIEMRGEKAVLKLPKGLPTNDLAKELEKHTGVPIEIEEVDMKDAAGHDHSHDHEGHSAAHSHAHDHGDHSHSHNHGHDSADHNHKH